MMKRHGMILFVVALLLIPAALFLSSCGKQEVKTEAQPAVAQVSPEADKAQREAEEAEIKKRDAARARAVEIEAKAKADAAKTAAERDKQYAAEMEAAAYAAKSLFLNQHVLFDFDKYSIRPDATMVLEAKAEYLTKNPALIVQIQGHCDERGTSDYNLALGDRRAHAAANYLETLGIKLDRLKTISYGEERPLNPGHTEEAWAENRRAQFVILSGE